MTETITAAPTPMQVIINDDMYVRAQPVELGEALVAIYLRVSSDGQAKKGFGLETQSEICNVYCENFRESHNWRVFGTYVEKKGVRGDTLDREAIDQIIRDARIHGIKFVVVAHLDRQSREEYAGLYIERILGEAGIKVVSATQDPNPYVVDLFIRSIHRAVAAEDKRKINKQTQEGIDKAARAGHWTGGPAPFGYEIVGQGKGRSSIRTCAAEAKVLLRAVELIVDERMNVSVACERLNDEGLLTRSGRVWTSGNLDKRLRSESADGLSTYRKVAGERRGQGTVRTKLDEYGRPLFGAPVVRQLPRIITPTRHRLLMKALADNGHDNERSDYFLTGHIIGRCGGTYHGALKKGEQKYSCNGKSSTTRREGCTDPVLRADLVDETVWSAVAEFLKDKDRLGELAKEWIGELPGDRDRHAENAEIIEKAVAKLKKQLATITTELTDPDLDEDLREIKEASKNGLLQTYKIKKTELGQVAKLLAEYDALHTDVLRIAELVQEAQLRLDDMTFTEKRVLLGLLKLRVEIDEDDFVPVSGQASPLDDWHREQGVLIPADPDDALWARAQDVIFRKERGRTAKVVRPERVRVQLRAILHRLRTGCRWTGLPEEFVPGAYKTWTGIAIAQHKWFNTGVWQELMPLLLEGGGSEIKTRKPLPKLLVTGRITPELLEQHTVIAAVQGQTPRRLSEESKIFSFILQTD